jgi:hypothetical protein
MMMIIIIIIIIYLVARQCKVIKRKHIIFTRN